MSARSRWETNMSEQLDAEDAAIPKAVLASLDQVYTILSALPEPYLNIKEDVEAILAQILARVKTWRR